MFSAWGKFVYRHRRIVLVASILIAIGLGFFAQKASDELSSGDWLLTNAESGQVADRLADDFDRGRSRLIALFRVTDGRSAASPEVQQQVEDAVSALRTDSRVHGVITYNTASSDPRLISRDGSATIHQDADIYRIRLAAGQSVTHEVRPGRAAWVQIADGALSLNDTNLVTGDGASTEDAGKLTLTAAGQTEALLFDLN